MVLIVVACGCYHMGMDAPAVATHEFNPRELRFINCYLVNGNATESYKLAGFDVKNDAVARANSSRLMAKPAIREEIQRRMQKMDMSPEEVMAELTRVAMNEGEDEFKWTHKLKALELIAKHKGMLGDSTKGTTNIETANILQVLSAPATVVEKMKETAVEEEEPTPETVPVVTEQ